MVKHIKLSFISQGLKYKLRIAVYLMSVLPLLVCSYLVSNYIIPQMGLKLDITVAIIISSIIAMIGFLVVKEVFDRILSVSSAARLIASGDISQVIEVDRQDEVGELGEALNELTQRIRSNMDELKNYGEKTTEINIQIQKRVFVLSNLLQISSLISQGAKLEDILKLTTDKSRLLADSDLAYLLFREETQEDFYMKAADGMNSERLLSIKLDPQESIFNKLIKTNKPLIFDKENTLPENIRSVFYEQFELRNTLALPVYLKGRVKAILGIGNTKETFVYRKEDLELLDIFAKQIAIAIENDILVHRIEKLEIKDTLTGLYNEAFIRSRLQEEIKRAITYQRPCALILFSIDKFQKFYQDFGSLQAEGALKKIASLIRDSVTEVDRVGRMGDNEFAVVLPEKNKRKAQEISENIRKTIEFSFSEEPDPNRKLTVSVGVSENPLDGIEAEELITKAKESFNLSKTEDKNYKVD